MSNEVENYLTAFNEADSLASNVRRTAEMIEAVAATLRTGTGAAAADVPTLWPNAEQLRNLLFELEEAKDRASRLWDALPADMRRRLPDPNRVGKVEVP